MLAVATTPQPPKSNKQPIGGTSHTLKSEVLYSLLYNLHALYLLRTHKLRGRPPLLCGSLPRDILQCCISLLGALHCGPSGPSGYAYLTMRIV